MLEEEAGGAAASPAPAVAAVVSVGPPDGTASAGASSSVSLPELTEHSARWTKQGKRHEKFSRFNSCIHIPVTLYLTQIHSDKIHLRAKETAGSRHSSVKTQCVDVAACKHVRETCT